MKKKTILVLLLIILFSVIATFLYFRKGVNKTGVIFVTAKAQIGYIAKTVSAVGTIQPIDTVSIGAQVSGVVKEVYVDFNSVVKKGQLLAKVDPSIVNAQKDLAKANLENAKSNLVYQQNNFERQNKLFQLGAISKSIFQLDLNQYNSAKAIYASASAQLGLAEKNVSYTSIYSPINGVILYRNVSAGQTIASSFNAPTLFVIAKDLARMQVKAAVDEADIGGVSQGQNVSFSVDAFPDNIFNGTVRQVLLRPSVSANVVTYTTIIDIVNNQLQLKPGMTASTNIFIEEDSNALLIPVRVLSFKPDTTLLKGYKIIRYNKQPSNKQPNAKTKNEIYTPNGKEDIQFVFIWVKENNNIIEKKITTQLNDNSYVKVLQGLSIGEEVVLNILQNNGSSQSNLIQRSPFLPQMQRRSNTTRN